MHAHANTLGSAHIIHARTLFILETDHSLKSKHVRVLYNRHRAHVQPIKFLARFILAFREYEVAALLCTFSVE